MLPITISVTRRKKNETNGKDNQTIFDTFSEKQPPNDGDMEKYDYLCRKLAYATNMNYYSTNHQAPVADLRKAVVKGLAEDRGLYMPEEIHHLPKTFFDDFSKMPKIYDYLRNKFIKTLAIGSDNYTDEAGILKGMLTGFKDSIPNKNSSILHDLGLGHLFAVSGIHIGIIAVTLNFVLSMVLIPKKFRGIIVIITIFFYVHAIGAPPSAKRAMTMFAFYLFCSSVGRSPNVLSALTNSALLYVLIDPFVVFNISFLLSYSVVCGIILIGTPLENFLKRKILNTYGLKISAFEKKDIILFHVKKHAISAFAIASSAYLSGMLFSIETFNTLTLLTIPVGILAIPIASCAIILGTISLIFGLVNIDFMCLILNKIAFNIIKFMNIILQLAHSDWCCIKDVHLPFFSGATLTSVLLVTSYTLLSYLHSNRHKKQVPDKLLAI